MVFLILGKIQNKHPPQAPQDPPQVPSYQVRTDCAPSLVLCFPHSGRLPPTAVLPSRAAGAPNSHFFLSLFMVVGMEPKALHVLGKCSTTDLHAQPSGHS